MVGSARTAQFPNSHECRKIMLQPIEIQLCHRVSADAFACTASEVEFLEKVRADARFADLNGDLQTTVLERSAKLRSLWIANGVTEPIKQNFLDEIEETAVEVSSVPVIDETPVSDGDAPSVV